MSSRSLKERLDSVNVQEEYSKLRPGEDWYRRPDADMAEQHSIAFNNRQSVVPDAYDLLRKRLRNSL